MKRIATALYFFIFALISACEFSEETSITTMLLYYLFVFANLLNAVRLINKHKQ